MPIVAPPQVYYECKSFRYKSKSPLIVSHSTKTVRRRARTCSSRACRALGRALASVAVEAHAGFSASVQMKTRDRTCRRLGCRGKDTWQSKSVLSNPRRWCSGLLDVHGALESWKPGPTTCQACARQTRQRRKSSRIFAVLGPALDDLDAIEIAGGWVLHHPYEEHRNCCQQGNSAQNPLAITSHRRPIT
jgi:hypothetical protein